MNDQPAAQHQPWEPVRRKSEIGLVMLAVAAAFGMTEPAFSRPPPPSARPLTEEEKARRAQHAQERIAAAQAKRERKAAKKGQT